MSTLRTSVTVGLALAMFGLAGCTTIKVQVSNESNRILPVTLSGGGRGVESLGKVGPYGDVLEKKTYQNWDLPASVTLKVGQERQVFTVSTDGPKAHRYRVNPEGKLVKRGEVETHERTIDIKEPVGEAEEIVE